MIYLNIFLSFFIANLLGYGGGPATIPLIQNEVVNHYHWMSLSEFGDVLAIANALPGPIATKMGGYIGYQLGGILEQSSHLSLQFFLQLWQLLYCLNL